MKDKLNDTHPVAEKLIEWYLLHKRELPWRNTADPYRIWISEIILQQTRVAQGMDYYRRFIERFPEVVSLADADEKEVMLLWQGLGYYSRARNLHAAAKTVRDEYGGEFPADYDSVRKLKGVGDYTAAAVCSFAFGICRPAVDGNVSRWISRIYAIGEPIDSTTGKKLIGKVAEELIPADRPGIFNQAAMEFGALQCVPGHPDCGRCPVKDHCGAFREKTVGLYPKKKTKRPQTERWFHYLVIRDGKNILLEKRTEKDIWRNLYQFPMVETDRTVTPEELFVSDAFRKILTGTRQKTPATVVRTPKHILSHRIIRAVFYEVEVERFTERMQGNYLTVPLAGIADYPLPKLIVNYLER